MAQSKLRVNGAGSGKYLKSVGDWLLLQNEKTSQEVSSSDKSLYLDNIIDEVLGQYEVRHPKPSISRKVARKMLRRDLTQRLTQELSAFGATPEEKPSE